MHGFNIAHFATFAPLPHDGQLRAMLDQHPALLSASADNGDVPLHGAAAAGNMDMIMHLLEHAQDVTVRCGIAAALMQCRLVLQMPGARSK